MTVKLNLTLDEKTAKRIKLYAARKGMSVSKIAETQFEEILKRDKPDTEFLEFVKKFSGFIKNKKPIDIDKAKYEYLRKKHGL